MGEKKNRKKNLGEGIFLEYKRFKNDLVILFVSYIFFKIEKVFKYLYMSIDVFWMFVFDFYLNVYVEVLILNGMVFGSRIFGREIYLDKVIGGFYDGFGIFLRRRRV